MLEYVPYCLNNFIRVGGLPIDIVRFYSAQILCALEYLHTEMDLVHRDLKPGNIMVTERDYIKLIDFGDSKVLIEDEGEYVQSVEARKKRN